MTKKDIVRTISEEVALTQQQTKRIVQKVFDAIIECLAREGRVELRNFGVFEAKQRAARSARNPRTGKQVDVPAKFVVSFKPGKEMEARVKQLESELRALAEANEMRDSLYGLGREADEDLDDLDINNLPTPKKAADQSAPAPTSSAKMNHRPYPTEG